MMKELVNFLKGAVSADCAAFNMVNENYRVQFSAVFTKSELEKSEEIILELVRHSIIDCHKDVYFGKGTANYPYIVILPLYEYNAFMGQVILTKNTPFDERDQEILIRGINLIQTEFHMRRQLGSCMQKIRVCDYMRILSADLPLEDRLLAAIQKLKRDLLCEISLWAWVEEIQGLVPQIASKNILFPEKHQEILYTEKNDLRIQALEEQAAMYSDQVEPDSIQEYSMLKSLGFTSIVAVPVMATREKQGVLMVYGTKDTPNLGLFESILHDIAAEIGTAMFQNKKWTQHIEKVMRMTTIHDIIQEVQQKELDFDDVMKNVVNIAPKVTGLSKCTIALVDLNKEYLMPKYSNYDCPMEGASYPLDKSKIKDHTGIIALQTREPVVVYDANLDERCDPVLAKYLGVLSNVTVPILDLQGEPLGVMYMDNGDYRIFTEEQIEYFKILARQIGLIIANSKIIQKMSRRAIKDGLTRLYNRRYLDKKYKEFLQEAKMYDFEFSLLMIDIDHFKSFNDTYGHSYGDEVLKAVAVQAMKHVRASDIVGRYGGEEIMILLPDTSYHTAYHIAERIREHISLLTFKRQVTVSIGIANSPRDGYENILEKADEALYQAKETERNKVSLYHQIVKRKEEQD